MPLNVVNDSSGLQRVNLSEPGGSSVGVTFFRLHTISFIFVDQYVILFVVSFFILQQSWFRLSRQDCSSVKIVLKFHPLGLSPIKNSNQVVLQGGQVVSWKNDRGEELLFVRNKNTARSPMAILGGISICFPEASSFRPLEQHEYVRTRLWRLEYGPLDQDSSGSQSSVNLILESSDKDLKMWPCRFELRLKITIGPGKLALMPSVRNVGDKSSSFTFSMHNCLSVSDISEVRVEGLETLDYLDNVLHKRRFTEQADALTFDAEVNRVYLNTPPKIAIIDHGKKRTFVLHKQGGLPDAVVWNPGDKPGKNVPYIGDDYKRMLSVDSAVFEKPVVLKPFQVWRGFQEISTVSSSYCSGQLDPRKVVQGTS